MASSPADSSLSVGENSPSAVALMDDSPSLRRRRSAPSEADPLADILSKVIKNTLFVTLLFKINTFKII